MLLQSVLLATGLLVPAGTAPSGANAYPPELLQPHLVAVSGGRCLNLFCTGQGSPTVIFEQGLGSNALHWKDVLPAVAEETRTCVYDRAGYGFSDAPTRSSDATNVTSDLHALLRAARVSTPIVLVGQSIGGLYATLYADRFPSEIAGLVLVDPSFADQAKGDPETPEDVAMLKRIDAESSRCEGLAREGGLTEADMKGCMPPTRPGRSPAEIAYLRAPYEHPGYYEATKSERQSFGQSAEIDSPDSRAEREAQRCFGSMPLIVLTRDPAGPHPPGVSEAQARRSEENWRVGHDRLAARSTRGRNTVVQGAGHVIQIDKPEAVIDAVREVVGEVRAPVSR